MEQNEWENLKPGDILGWFYKSDYCEVEIIEKQGRNTYLCNTTRDDVCPHNVGKPQVICTRANWNIIKKKAKDMENDKFWVIYAKGATLPISCFSETEAKRAALECAVKNPGTRYFVCEVTGFAETSAPTYTEIK